MIKPDNRPYGRRENMPTGLRPWKCTPIPACGGTSPGGGSLLSAYPCANLSRSLHSAARISPSGGEAAAGGRRGAFPSRQRRGCKGFSSPIVIHCKYCKSFLPLKSAPPGKKPPQAAEGVHFLAPKARLYGFPRPQGGLPVFLRAKPGC